MKYQTDTDDQSDTCKAISNKKSPIVTLYHNKMKLLKHLDYISHGSINHNSLNVTLNPNIAEKYNVPIGYSTQTKLEWLAGLCDADGCVAINKTNKSIQIANIHKDFLVNIRYMLHECGIESSIRILNDIRQSYLPTHNKQNDYAYYTSKKTYRLIINSSNLYKLQ